MLANGIAMLAKTAFNATLCCDMSLKRFFTNVDILSLIRIFLSSVMPYCIVCASSMTSQCVKMSWSGFGNIAFALSRLNPMSFAPKISDSMPNPSNFACFNMASTRSSLIVFSSKLVWQWFLVVFLTI